MVIWFVKRRGGGTKIRRLGINAHSLRYAFITYMLRKGVSPSIIVAITGHKNLNMILKYTEKKAAESILEGFEQLLQ